MKHWKAILVLLMLVAMMLAGCAPAATSTPTPKAVVETSMIIGYTASQTDRLQPQFLQVYLSFTLVLVHYGGKLPLQIGSDFTTYDKFIVAQ